MYLGAHVSAAGGISNAITNGQNIGAECIQIFAASPRTWASKPIADAEIEKYRALNAKSGLGPALIHSKYLVGLGSDNPESIAKSIDALVFDLDVAGKIGGLGAVFHPASHKGRGFETVKQQFVDGVKQVLAQAPDNVFLMMETSAGSGDHIGSKLAELGAIIEAVGDSRLAVCVDTQHMWAAGYDISKPDTLEEIFKQFDSQIGLDRLKAVHVNDSKKPLGSAVDRHDNIGQGLIGEAGFLNFLSHPAVQDLPMYLEVPGMGPDSKGPDRPNLDILKRLRSQISG